MHETSPPDSVARPNTIGFQLVDPPSPGWDLNHPYLETFWLPTIGPTSTLLLRYVGRHIRTTGTVPFDIAELGFALGVSHRNGKNSPINRTIDRLCRFGLATITIQHPSSELHVEIPRELPAVPLHAQRRWPEQLRILHSRAIAHHHLDTAAKKAA